MQLSIYTCYLFEILDYKDTIFRNFKKCLEKYGLLSSMSGKIYFFTKIVWNKVAYFRKCLEILKRNVCGNHDSASNLIEGTFTLKILKGEGGGGGGRAFNRSNTVFQRNFVIVSKNYILKFSSFNPVKSFILSFLFPVCVDVRT